MAGLYLHIPFCTRACHYCDFHFSTNTAGANALLAAMVQEAQFQQSYLHEPIRTLYLGGGTPSVLTPAQLRSLLDGISRHQNLAHVEEFTLEANPEHVTPENIAVWQQVGVNRISLGVQTFNDVALQQLNRGHTGAQAVDAFALLQAAGFGNISVDLMFALPSQTLPELEQDLDQILNLGIQHVSLYCLTVEAQTVFGRRLAKGQLQPMPEDLSADMMSRVWERLEQASFDGYEISSYALPGYASKHNSAYWQGVPYLGLGPSAHSFKGGERSWSVRSNGAYVQKLAQGLLPQEHETLTATDRFNERIMTGLRMKKGIPLAELEAIFGKPLPSAWHTTLNKFVGNGNLWLDADMVRLTLKGRLLADHLAGQLFLE